MFAGRTVLQVAVETHDPIGRDVKCLATTRLLLENGASARVKESRCGDTALHMAISLSCDPALVKVIYRGTSRARASLTREIEIVVIAHRRSRLIEF